MVLVLETETVADLALVANNLDLSILSLASVLVKAEFTPPF
jgi:hypothetical protein